MKISEALREIDELLRGWMLKGGLAPEQLEQLVRARSALFEVESRLLIARIVDPKESEEFAEVRYEDMKRLALELSKRE